MAWDFQTDPEFQKKLDWAKDFVVNELIPLEPLLELVYSVMKCGKKKS